MRKPASTALAAMIVSLSWVVPLLAHAQETCTGPNVSANYIVGVVGGTASAMHWQSGLVWKRCAEGQTWDGSSCGVGTSNTLMKSWNEWVNTGGGLLPRAFADQANWGVTLSASHDLLASGSWRMAYAQEMEGIKLDCEIGPPGMVNRTVFPGSPPWNHWSASPSRNTFTHAWTTHFGTFGSPVFPREYSYHTRLVRGGQPFAALPASIPVATTAAGQTAVFAPLTLASQSGSGAAWGGARITGGQFQINGVGAWLTEAIITSGDQIAVRVAAPATPGQQNTGTLTLRSGLTTGTRDDGANGGDEDTVVQESSADFTAQAAQPTTYTIGGSITGLTGSGLVLRNNGGDALPVSAGASSFTFDTPVGQNAFYDVTVQNQPTGQSCTVLGGTGVNVSANVTSVQVRCMTVQADNCTAASINTRGNYILGEAGGTPSAMHWVTGLVWKRCSEGQGWDEAAQLCTGANASQNWGEWAGTDARLPLAFEDQEGWRVENLPASHNLLVGGGWRMAYKSELLRITEDCGAMPTLNRDVFSGAQPARGLWSASPYAPQQENAWFVNFDQGFAGQYDGIGMGTRLVRGGQPFGDLPGQTKTAAAGQSTAVEFAPVTLAASVEGQAWGGARISGDGSPEFRIGNGPWVTEGIIGSGDAITVRMMAPSAVGASRTATLVLRSALTTGTSAHAANGGEEASQMQEVAASFTLVGASPGTGPGTGGVQPVPALSGWMLALLGTVLGGLGLLARRRASRA
ncbi:MAG: DUF1566 domain-containing protein [Ottowia sp.]|uniref:Lcl C-terminal domain-containing protein n=1 Tax=Ottowia sp. TaxID=1898956 RepID=UPI003C732442